MTANIRHTCQALKRDSNGNVVPCGLISFMGGNRCCLHLPLSNEPWLAQEALIAQAQTQPTQEGQPMK